MRYLEGLELWRQPQRRDSGGTAQRHGLVVLLCRKQLVGDRIEALQRFMHCLQVSLTRAGQRQPAVMTNKQGRVQVGFQLTHLLADGGLRDLEIDRGARETLVQARRLEGPQDI